MELSVIIPIFNEEENIEPLLDELYGVLDGLGKSYEVILVDDGSEDSSFDKLCNLKNEHSKLIRLARNFGQTAALQAGLDHAEGDIIITMDGDLQNDPHDIPGLINQIEKGLDVVSGWRRHRLDPLSKRLPSTVANRLLAGLTKIPLHDFGCTLKAYRKCVIKNIRLFGEMHRFLPALVVWEGAKIFELEVNHRARRFGVSKYGITRTFRVILDLIAVKFLVSHRSSPIQAFGGWGIFSFFVSIISGIATVLMKVGPRKIDMTGNPLLYLTVLLAVVGVQFIMLGLLGETIVRTTREAKLTYIISSIVG